MYGQPSAHRSIDASLFLRIAGVIDLRNREVASIFERMADILEFKGENEFKIRAYRRAARVISDLTEDIERIAESGQLESVPGIGKAIAKKIEEYLTTGRMSKFEEVKRGIPDSLIDLMEVPGLGPKSLAILNRELGVENLDDLRRVIDEGKVLDLPGFGRKKAENILRGIELYRSSRGRIPLGVAEPVASRIVNNMRGSGYVGSIEAAGSLRRMKETIGDIDILATGPDGKRIIDTFVGLPYVREVLAAGDTKGSVIVDDGLQVDLRVVDDGSYGAALAYFTGSKAHNIRLRDIAKDRGLKINEYGIWRGGVRLGGRVEEEIYSALGMIWIPPEMREDRGEVEAALEGRLPDLITESDIRGDLHVHSKWSDGSATLEEIAAEAMRRGYEYVAITDHSRSLRIAGGLTEDEVWRQIEEIERLNRTYTGFRLLSGTEVDIRADGTLDYPDGLLARLDIVIASVHTSFKQDEAAMTDRITAAMENPNVDVIGHPTGRLLGEREEYRVDMERVMEAAARTGTALEINAYYQRLDLNDVNCRRAKEMGVKLAIGTDAHHLDQMRMMKLGVGTARRGWLERKDVINTMSLEEILKWLRRRNG